MPLCLHHVHQDMHTCTDRAIVDVACAQRSFGRLNRGRRGVADTHTHTHTHTHRALYTRTFDFVLPSRAIFAVPLFGAFPSLHVLARDTRSACGATRGVLPGDAVPTIASSDALTGSHGLPRRTTAALGRGSSSVLSSSTRRTLHRTRRGELPSRTQTARGSATCVERLEGGKAVRDGGSIMMAFACI